MKSECELWEYIVGCDTFIIMYAYIRRRYVWRSHGVHLVRWLVRHSSMQYDVYFRCYIYDGSRIGVTYVTRVYVSSVIPVSLPFIQHAACCFALLEGGRRRGSPNLSTDFVWSRRTTLRLDLYSREASLLYHICCFNIPLYITNNRTRDKSLFIWSGECF